MAKLYFYYSSMNAGKSTALLQSSYNYRERGMNTLVLTPLLDDRYGVGKVTSRIGLEANATSFKSDVDLYELVSSRNKEEPLNCVLLDEAQFLTKEQVFQLGEVTDELDIPVLAYGIRTDFQGEPLTQSRRVRRSRSVATTVTCRCAASTSRKIIFGRRSCRSISYRWWSMTRMAIRRELLVRVLLLAVAGSEIGRYRQRRRAPSCEQFSHV
jgi:thymidine kinase